MGLMYGRSVLAEDERLRVSQDLWPPYIVNSAYGSGIAYDGHWCTRRRRT